LILSLKGQDIAKSKEIIHPDQMCDMPNASSMISVLIPYPCLIESEGLAAARAIDDQVITIEF
jgi:hypothetical protein